MKRTLLFIAFALSSIMMHAQGEGTLEVDDVHDSGCTDKTRASSSSDIILIKEGDIITCQLLGIVANCGVEYFEVQPYYVKGENDAPDSLSLNVSPIVPSEKDCTCPYNVTFSIRNVTSDSFYLNCWLYSGMISFKESNQVEIDVSSKFVQLDDGSRYYLFKPSNLAIMFWMSSNDLKGEVRIPSTVNYEGEDYTLVSFYPDALNGMEITNLILPNTIRMIGTGEELYNPCAGKFPKLETIEVEQGCPLLSSVEGVLYSRDFKTIYCLPVGNKQTEYTVMEGVETIGKYAFGGCMSLKEIRLPESVTYIRPYAFSSSNNLQGIYIPGKLNREGLYKAFLYMSSTPTLYVPESEVEFYKTIYKGPVLPIANNRYFPTGMKWEEIVVTPYMELEDNNAHIYEISTDTLINETTYKKVLRDKEFCGICVRESGEKVWLKTDDCPTEILLYDFDWDDKQEIVTEYLKMEMEENEEEDPEGLLETGVLQETFTVAGCPTVLIDGKTYQYIRKAGRTIIRGIGKVAELNRYPCLLGYKEEYEILPGVNYHKVHWIQRNGVEIFRSENPNEWTDEVPENDYRPFVEDGKVWAVKVYPDGYGMVTNNSWIECCYFDGDTIIGGQTCKQMKSISNANAENWVNGVFTPAGRTQQYVGAWYEKDKKVYYAGRNQEQFQLLYDFTLSSGETMNIDGYEYVVNKMTGGLPGFKGTYYEIGEHVRWFEGVGSDSWPYRNHPWLFPGHTGILLACRIGDEFIYCSSSEADPMVMGARKRIDFTHTIKVRPKAPSKRETSDKKGETVEESLYGEYNDVQLGINLNPLDDAYLVRITDETGKSVYEKAVNAGSIVGLNIDISTYPKGRYTVTVENGSESFTGEFEAQTTGVVENLRIEKLENGSIFDLQGRRLSGKPAKGVYIENGRKRVR